MFDGDRMPTSRRDKKREKGKGLELKFINSQHLRHQHPMWVLIDTLAVQLLIQFPTNVLRKGAKHGQNVGTSAIHMVYRDEAPSF